MIVSEETKGRCLSFEIGKYFIYSYIFMITNWHILFGYVMEIVGFKSSSEL